MPELPDVEAFRLYLEEHAAGRRVDHVEVPDADVLRNTSPQGLGQAVAGRRFATPERHGKWLLAHLDDRDRTVVMHFGMTGYLTWVDGHGSDAPEREAHDHVVFVCDDGELRFNLTRKLGGVWYASSAAQLREVTGELGPDARDVSREDLADLLDGRRGGLKSALMDQELVAGIGNIVADEVLWHARLHPRTPVASLDDDRLADLHGALTDVLEESIEHGQVPRREDWLTHARDVEDPVCPRCGADIVNGEVNSRTTYWCPDCQPQ